MTAYLLPQVTTVFSQVPSPVMMPGGQGVAGSNPAVPTGQMGFSSLHSGANWGANGFPRAGLSQLGGLRLQDAVHGRCALGEREPDLVTVNRLGHRHAAVPDQVADVLQADIVCAQDGHERMP